MSIYFYKGSPIETPVTITSDRFYYESTSLSLKRQITSTEGQRWILDFNVKQNPHADEQSMFLEHVSEPFRVHSMVMPQLPSVDRKAVLSKARTRSGNYSAGTDTIPITRGFPAGETNGTANQVYPKGMFIRFANHPKVYVVTETIAWGSANDTVMNIFPKLVHPVPVGTEIHLGNACEITYILDSSVIKGLTFTDGIISSPGTVRIIENI